LLGKEKPETCEVDLSIIDFRLREVGIECQVYLELRSHVIEEVCSAGSFCRRWVTAAGNLAICTDDIRFDIEADSLADIRDADQPSLAGQIHQALVPGESRPERLFVLSPDGPLEIGAPGIGPGIEIQRFERYLNFCR